jgi:cell division protein FtsW
MPFTRTPTRGLPGDRITPFPSHRARLASPTRRFPLTIRPTGQRTYQFVVLFAAAAVLASLGLIMVLSASAAADAVSAGASYDSWYSFKRHAMWLAAGVAAMLVTLRIQYRFWARVATPLLFVSIAMLVAVLVPGVGVQANGATRWIGYGSLTIQPAEIAKLALVIFCAELLGRPTRPAWNTQLVVRPVLAVFGVIAILLMLQPNLGTTLVCGAIVLALWFAAGVQARVLAACGAAGAVLAILLAVAAPYRFARLTGFLDPWGRRGNEGYQVVQSIASVAHGGIAGVGIGASRGKWGYLPFAYTDFIFAVIAEELGLVGSLMVIVLFLLIGIMGVLTAVRAPDRFGSLLATGITAWLLIQAIVNIGVVLGVLPVTGVPLPFLSYGGSSLVVTMGTFGILLNVARHAR